MKNKLRSQLVDFSILSLFAVTLLVFALPVIPLGSDNIRLIHVFSADEANAVQIVTNMIVSRSLSTGGFFSYGALYFYLSALLAFPFTLFLPLPVETIAIIALRGVCTVASIGTLFVSYLHARNLFDRPTALLSPVIMVVTLNFLHWSVTAHPDTLQMLLVLISLYYTHRLVVDSYKRFYLLMASGFAGLAFGTKYVGVFLLPIICLGIAFVTRLQKKRGDFHFRAAASDIARRYLLAFATFSATFVIANPYALIEFDQFMKAVSDLVPIFFTIIPNASPGTSGKYIGSGYLKPGESRLVWFTIIGSESIFRSMGAVFLGIGLVLWVRHWYFDPQRKLRKKLGAALIFAWIVLYFGYLFAFARFREPRHLFPILFFLAMLSAYGLLSPLRLRHYLKQHQWVTPALTGGLVIATIWPGAVGGYDYHQSLKDKMIDNPAIQAGEWLSANVSTVRTVLYDAYAYVPPEFDRVAISYGTNWEMVLRFRTNILITYSNVTNRYSDLSKADHWLAGQEVYLNSHDFYLSLARDCNLCYYQVADFGEAKVYALRYWPCFDDVYQFLSEYRDQAADAEPWRYIQSQPGADTSLRRLQLLFEQGSWENVPLDALINFQFFSDPDLVEKIQSHLLVHLPSNINTVLVDHNGTARLRVMGYSTHELSVEEHVCKVNVYFQALDDLDTDYVVSLRAYSENTAILPEDQQQRGYLSFDYSPGVPTSEWQRDNVYRHSTVIQANPGRYRFVFSLYRKDDNSHLCLAQSEDYQIDLGWHEIR